LPAVAPFYQKLARLVTQRHFEMFSIFAAADEAMGLLGWPVIMVPPEAGFVDSCGIVIVSLHDGHSISRPAPALSTASSCPHLGQSKMMSINCHDPTVHPV